MLNPVERPTWDEFKKQQQAKGEMESATAWLEEDEVAVLAGARRGARGAAERRRLVELQSKKEKKGQFR